VHEIELQSFDEKCVSALKQLQAKLDFGLWMVTKVDGDDWIVLKAVDRDYGVQDGDVFVWMESFCCSMVQGLGPTFAPNSENVPAYAQAKIGQKVPIQAYMGFPLRDAQGELIGTLCAINPTTVPESWAEHEQFANDIAEKLSHDYQKEYDHAILSLDESISYSSAESDVTLHTPCHWNDVMEAHRQQSTQKDVSMSVLTVKVDVRYIDQSNLTNSLHKTLGRSNFLSYQGNGIYAALLMNCNAPKLDAYIKLTNICLTKFGVTHKIGSCVCSPTKGITEAYEFALSRVDSNNSSAA
jgi:hypothetical protein